MSARAATLPFAWAAVGGSLIAVSFLDFSLGPLAWIAFIPLLHALHAARSPRRVLQLGLVAGLATNVPAFYWLVGTIHRFGGFPLPLALFFYVVLSLYGALQFALFGLGLRRLGRGRLCLAAPLLWVALELLYPNLFPWRLANSQLEHPVLLQIGEITGPFGLSFVMVWLAASVAAALERGLRTTAPALGASMAAVVVVVAYGVFRLPAVERALSVAPAVRVGVVQGDLSIAEKGNVAYLESNLATYRRLSETVAARSDVVIWPETVIEEPLPRDLERLTLGARAALGLHGPLLTGAMTFAGDPEHPVFYNSVVLFDGDGRLLGLSDKQILMPFGEYLPFGSVFPWLKHLSPQTGDFRAGTRIVPLDVPGVGRFAPLNCYEDLRESIPRAAVRDDRAEILFSVANDAWFGHSAAPLQHEALALWRAIENRRYLVRVTNTGVTDVIDPAGRVALRLPLFEARAEVAEVRRMQFDTVYTRVGPVGAWLAVFTVAVALIRSASGRRRT